MPDLTHARRILREGVERRVYPSAVLVVADHGETLLCEAVGAATPDTVYDVASLTKPLATGLAAMLLADRGRLDTEATLAEALPRAFARAPDRPLARVRVRHLLAHASGLPAHRPLFRACRGARAVRDAVLRTPLVYPPGTRSLYSDLGFILLGEVVRRAAGQGLARLLRERISRPLGLGDTALLASPRDARARRRRARRGRFAPTGWCAFRRRRLCGEVHDANAFAMGGFGGHAGLFASAPDLSRLCAELVAAFAGGSRLLSRDVVRRFWRPALPGRSTWCLGWDTPSPRGYRSGGRLMPAHAVGHLAFTGCSVWIDPRRERWILLLSNRTVHRGSQPRLRALRPRLHDAILAALP